MDRQWLERLAKHAQEGGRPAGVTKFNVGGLHIETDQRVVVVDTTTTTARFVIGGEASDGAGAV